MGPSEAFSDRHTPRGRTARLGAVMLESPMPVSCTRPSSEALPDAAAKPSLLNVQPQGQTRADALDADGHFVLSNENAIDFLAGLPKASVDLLFLDPPFNLGKVYGNSESLSDSLTEEQYTAFLTEVLDHSVSTLAPGGSLFLYHLPSRAIWVASMLARRLTFRHWIAVSMKAGYAKREHLYPAHYALLYFSNGQPSSFARPKVPIRVCRKCNATLKDYGGYSKYLNGQVSLSDVWDDLSPVRHSKHKYRRANELPPEFYRRLLNIAGRPGSTYVEPFAGSGKGALMAHTLGMTVYANDSDPDACLLIRRRFIEQ